MFLYPAKLKSSKGVSVISLIIIAAAVVGALNAYTFYNPDFQLNKYSFVTLLRSRSDQQRIADLEDIRTALELYYEDKGDYPARDGFCGRIHTILNSAVRNAILPYFPDEGIPQDPAFRGTNKDYFYKKVDRNVYILMAVLENVPDGTTTYSFRGCHDWPGDGVYNYRILHER